MAEGNGDNASEYIAQVHSELCEPGESLGTSEPVTRAREATKESKAKFEENLSQKYRTPEGSSARKRWQSRKSTVANDGADEIFLDELKDALVDIEQETATLDENYEIDRIAEQRASESARAYNDQAGQYRNELERKGAVVADDNDYESKIEEEENYSD